MIQEAEMLKRLISFTAVSNHTCQSACQPVIMSAFYLGKTFFIIPASV